MASTVFPASAAGGSSNLTQAQVAATVPSYTLQHTISSSTNNFATNASQAFVYAVVVGGGGLGNSGNQGVGGPSGSVIFGMTPVRAAVLIGGSTSPTSFGNILSTGGSTTGPSFVADLTGSTSFGLSARGGKGGAGQSALAAGGGATGYSGGNSIAGYNGGATGANASGSSSGGGGGAGVLGNGGNAPAGQVNSTPAGGIGGSGGGGGGMGSANNNFCGLSTGASGVGGGGVVLVYY